MYEGFMIRTRKQGMRRRKLRWFFQDTAMVVIWIFIGYLIALGVVAFSN